jgi:hypothetical protein
MRTFLSGLFLVLAVSVGPASAQPTWQNQLAVTGGAQFPTGAFDDRVKTGSGLAATYYYRPSTYFFFGLRGGFHRFQAQGRDAQLDVVPLQFASKYNFSVTGVQPYVGLDGGFYLLRPETGDGSSEFGVAPKFGLRLPIASGVDIDLNATYEVILRDPDNTTYVGLNAGVAYIFGR